MRINIIWPLRQDQWIYQSKNLLGTVNINGNCEYSMKTSVRTEKPELTKVSEHK